MQNSHKKWSTLVYIVYSIYVPFTFTSPKKTPYTFPKGTSTSPPLGVARQPFNTDSGTFSERPAYAAHSWLENGPIFPAKYHQNGECRSFQWPITTKIAGGKWVGWAMAMLVLGSVDLSNCLSGLSLYNSWLENRPGLSRCISYSKWGYSCQLWLVYQRVTYWWDSWANMGKIVDPSTLQIFPPQITEVPLGTFRFGKMGCCSCW